MAWIESHQELRSHPKMLMLCRTLSAARPKMVGHLHLLWWWCMDYAMDGNLSRYDDRQIADAAEWVADPKVFLEGMISSGFIDRTGDKLKIHDWHDFCGELIHKRLRRKEEKRQKSADIVRQSMPKSAEVAPTRPYQTVPDQTKPTPRKTPPASPAFEEIWKQYPRPEGKKQALRHFLASVKSTKDLWDMKIALANYTATISRNHTEMQFVKTGATWFNNWRDYIDFKLQPDKIMKPASPPPKPREPDPPEPTEDEVKEMHQRTVDELFNGQCREKDCRFHA